MCEMKTLGVLGGLGPMATAYFMELVTEMTEAAVDQDHVDMVIYSTPSVPDRTAYLLDHTQPDPLPHMLRVGHKLAQQKVAAIAIPCVTAHYFMDRLTAELAAPILNAVEETVLELKWAGIRRVGIMATAGTVHAGIFRKALEAQGMQAIVPGSQGQADVMHLIYENIKAGKQPEMGRFYAVRQELFDAGAEAIILGCTELSMIKRDYALGPGFIDVMEVMAQRAILACGKEVKQGYQKLLTT